MTNALTGTTAPIFVPRTPNPQSILQGRNYFFIQIHNAQAAYYGPIWQQTQGLAVTTQVNLSHEALGGAVKALHRTRRVERNRAEQLGLSPNLVDVVPATMSRVSISVDFILDRKNQLVTLSKIINNDGLFATISFAPGAAIAAKTLSKLAQQLIENFIPAEDSVPLLQFSGDFNLAGDGLKEGYYVILGSRDDANPLPSPYLPLAVRDRMLLVDDRPATQLSYLILNIQCVPARTRDGNESAAWNQKLREAEDKAQSVLDNPLATNDERDRGWNDCVKLLTEGQTLLRSDPTYLREEAAKIVKSVYDRCRRLVTEEGAKRGANFKGDWTPDEGAARHRLEISPSEDFESTLDDYAEEVLVTRRALKTAGIR